MGLFDKVKQQASGLVRGRSKQVGDAVDKVADTVDDKTGGKHSDKIDDAATKVKGVIEDLDGDA